MLLFLMFGIALAVSANIFYLQILSKKIKRLEKTLDCSGVIRKHDNFSLTTVANHAMQLVVKHDREIAEINNVLGHHNLDEYK